jgi:hypothetical protein
LCDDLAIDRRDVLQSRVAKLVAAVEGDEDDNNEPEKKSYDPRSLAFAQDIEHKPETLSKNLKRSFHNKKKTLGLQPLAARQPAFFLWFFITLPEKPKSVIFSVLKPFF